MPFCGVDAYGKAEGSVEVKVVQAVRGTRQNSPKKPRQPPALQSGLQ